MKYAIEICKMHAISSFLVAVYIATTVFLIMYSDSRTVGDFALTSVPSYMQGIGTLVAAYFAICAFEAWRRPEDAKRRGDAAQLILRQSQKVEYASLDARHEQTIVNFAKNSLDLADKLDALNSLTPNNKSNEINIAKHELNEFRTYRIECHYLLGSEQAELMDRFIFNCNEVIQAYARVEILKNAPPTTQAMSGFEQLVDRTLAALGTAVLLDFELDDQVDSVGNEIRASGLKLRETLAPFLVERRAT